MSKQSQWADRANAYLVNLLRQEAHLIVDDLERHDPWCPTYLVAAELVELCGKTVQQFLAEHPRP